MTSRERVLTALDHRTPDRIPVYADFTPEAGESMARRLSVDRGEPVTPADIPAVLGLDMVVAGHGVGMSYYAHSEEEYTCEWGIGWRWVDVAGGRYTEIVGHPLADERALDGWSPPEPDMPGKYDRMEELLASHGAIHAVVGGMGSILFEPAWHLRGFEQFLMDLATNEDFVTVLLDKIEAHQLVTGKRLAALGADILWLGDDFGTQESLICSPETFRRHFKDRYARLFGAFHEVKPDIHIAFHSDGNVEALLPDFIDMGVDIFQAVQPKSVDPARLKRRFGDRLSFWGAIDIQETMPFGTPADVRDEVRLRMETVGRGGGYILAPSHAIQPDVPVENVLALFGAVEEFGYYR